MPSDYFKVYTEHLRRNNPRLWLLQTPAVASFSIGFALVSTAAALIYPVRDTFVPRAELPFLFLIIVSLLAIVRWLYLVSQPLKWPHLRTFDHEPGPFTVAIYCAALLMPPYLFGAILEARIFAVIDPNEAALWSRVLQFDASGRYAANNFSLAALTRFPEGSPAGELPQSIPGLDKGVSEGISYYHYPINTLNDGWRDMSAERYLSRLYAEEPSRMRDRIDKYRVCRGIDTVVHLTQLWLRSKDKINSSTLAEFLEQAAVRFELPAQLQSFLYARIKAIGRYVRIKSDENIISYYPERRRTFLDRQLILDGRSILDGQSINSFVYGRRSNRIREHIERELSFTPIERCSSLSKLNSRAAGAEAAGWIDDVSLGDFQSLTEEVRLFQKYVDSVAVQFGATGHRTIFNDGLLEADLIGQHDAQDGQLSQSLKRVEADAAIFILAIENLENVAAARWGIGDLFWFRGAIVALILPSIAFSCALIVFVSRRCRRGQLISAFLAAIPGTLALLWFLYFLSEEGSLLQEFFDPSVPLKIVSRALIVLIPVWLVVSRVVNSNAIGTLALIVMSPLLTLSLIKIISDIVLFGLDKIESSLIGYVLLVFWLGTLVLILRALTDTWTGLQLASD